MNVSRVFRYIALACLIALLLLLWKGSKPEVKIARETTSAPETIAPSNTQQVFTNKEAEQRSGQPNPNTSLGEALGMAAFIDQIIESIPRERFATRDHLKGIQAVFFISDYIMGSRTNDSFALPISGVIDSFSSAGRDASFVKERLRMWAIRPGGLSEHYKSISEIPSEKENIASIKSALADTGSPVALDSDLLMDCIRYVVHGTGIREMYGPDPRDKANATPFPAELNSLIETGDAVFRRRFTGKFGMSADAANALMDRLGKLRLENLSPADVEIPVSRIQ